MTIGDISTMVSSLSMLQQDSVGGEIQTAVLKKALDMQENQNAAVLAMLNSAVTGRGGNIDLMA